MSKRGEREARTRCQHWRLSDDVYFDVFLFGVHNPLIMYCLLFLTKHDMAEKCLNLNLRHNLL